MTPTDEASSELDGGRVCLLVTGAPGAGKTTVAGNLARSMSRSSVISGDTVARLVVGGYVWPLGHPPEEAAGQVALCNDNICSLAANFMAAGFTPVIDWVVPDADQLDVFRNALGARLRLVFSTRVPPHASRATSSVRRRNSSPLTVTSSSVRPCGTGSVRGVGGWTPPISTQTAPADTSFAGHTERAGC